LASRSKRTNERISINKAIDAALVIFLWAFCTGFSPEFEAIEKVGREIRSVRESINSGALTIPQLRKALKDEYELEV
jgi:hypothetical protein